MANFSRKKRGGLTEVDENDLNVSLAHDDVSMTGQEGDAMVLQRLMENIPILLLYVRKTVLSTNLEGPDSYPNFICDIHSFSKNQYFSAQPES